MSDETGRLPAGEHGVETIEAALGRDVRALRRSASLTQQEVADRANLSLGAVKNLEAGRGSSVRTLVRVLRVLDRLDWFDDLHTPTATFNPFDLGPAPRSEG